MNERMTSEEFRRALTTLGWSVAYVAQMTGKSVGTIINWKKDHASPPVWLSVWLRSRLLDHADNPPPDQSARNDRGKISE